ncbi:MAG: histidine-type phosphatase [Rikenellaceae bacterium]|nr:histidine-type phosphatase [Rikenellaceae bacterium]
MKHPNYLLTAVFLLISASSLLSQTTKEEFLKNRRHASGIYQPYYFEAVESTPAPKGYKPFYISHYGRHGSRWVQTAETYTYPQGILSKAHDEGKLTPLGESVYKRVDAAAKDAWNRYGDLSQLGANEHREIAERMFQSFPEVFSTKKGKQCKVYSRSTVVPRCILSMAANNEKLKELNPRIKFIREASDRNRYLNNRYTQTKKDSVNAIRDNFLAERLNLNGFKSKLFNDSVYAARIVDNPLSFMKSIHLIATDIPCVDSLDFTLFDIFTDDELFTLWQGNNMSLYYTCGPSNANGKVVRDSSKLLLKDILDCAEKAVNGGDISADLRFGHDTYIIPLLTLMDIKGMNITTDNPEKIYQFWSDFKISPMGVNLQIIFYRSSNDSEILVKLLHCEKEVEIPIKSDIAPYYKWEDFKAYYKAKLSE